MDRKGKKAVSTSNQVGRSSDGRIDEMGKLLKHLSDKIDRLEVGSRNRNQNKSMPENDRNLNQFRRPFAPRFFPRERRNNDIQRERRENEEQKIQPPFQKNNLRGDESYEFDEGELDELEDEEQDISQFDDDAPSHFVTRSDYQYATELDQYE